MPGQHPGKRKPKKRTLRKRSTKKRKRLVSISHWTYSLNNEALMIPYRKTLRAVENEWCRMELRELRTDFVRGIIQGLKLGHAIIKEVWIREKRKTWPNPSGSKTSYFKAICVAHDHLKRCDRSKAIAILSRIMERVEKEEQAKLASKEKPNGKNQIE